MPEEVVDIPKLQRMGILKKQFPKTESPEYKEVSSNPLAFLDTFANSASTNNLSSSDVSELKIKLDNLEYQIERLVERLSVVEGKMNEFGKEN